MRSPLLLLLLLAGCPWISASEHAENQRIFDAVPGVTGATGTTAHTGTPADTDTDTDADTDADTDVDTDTDVDCIDDAFEPNDSLTDATFVTAGTTVDATVCPPGSGSAVDIFELVPGPDNVVDVSLAAGSTACSDLALRVELRGEDDDLRGWARADGTCPSFTTGGYGDGLVRAYVVSEGEAAQGYALTVDLTACATDADIDGYKSSACGGPDCDDAAADIYPGAAETPGDGIDSDCDGGDQMATCGQVPPMSTTEAETLACGDGVTGRVWDAWTVAAPANACIGVAVDNLSVASDPVAVVVNPAGDVLRLDNEEDCTEPPWTRALVFPFDQGCPSGGAGSTRAGVHTIWVSQVDDPTGVNCPSDAPYALSVWVNGTEVAPTLVGDDVVFSP